MAVDFGKTADDYASHRAGFPPSVYTTLAKLGIDVASKRIVDLGTGTGTLARGFAARGAHCIGIDPAAPMLDQARTLAARDGVVVEFRVGKAEDTGLPDASVDIVSAGQCWHWFDRERASRECRRILAPGGVVLLAHFDWIPLPGNVVEATEQLIKAHNPAWRFDGGNGVYGRWLTDLGAAGFVELESVSYDEFPVYSHDAWRGRVRASAGIAASLAQDAVTRFDTEHAALLRSRFPEDPLHIHHRVWLGTGKRPL